MKSDKECRVEKGVEGGGLRSKMNFCNWCLSSGHVTIKEPCTEISLCFIAHRSIKVFYVLSLGKQT
jgi:hypothetical protein